MLLRKLVLGLALNSFYDGHPRTLTNLFDIKGKLAETSLVPRHRRAGSQRISAVQR
jgi:hypothetical protein